ncbi:serine/threonine-protein kinase [Embleya sp. NPDC059237]|uniref:serine/threonine-protein kinase n=1 Tax=Embleya sp. NPDC059237 TaxID=3346784 RepID=UPI0036D19F7C
MTSADDEAAGAGRGPFRARPTRDAAGPGSAETRREGPARTRREAPPPPPDVDEDEVLTVLPRVLADRFTLVRELPQFGGEAHLLVVRAGNGAEFVLKIYRRHGEQASRAVWRALETIDAAHVVRILETGQAGRRDFELMEYVRGGNLAELVGRDGTGADPRLVTEVVAQIASVLTRLHAAGIVHQDLKPENVLVRSEHPLDLALTDFGISRLLEHTRAAATGSGTLAYLAPELLLRTGGHTSPGRDWWALGMIARELLIGQRPFEDMLEPALDAAIMLRGIDLSAIGSNRMRLLCTGLLTRDPDSRWGADEVGRWLAGESPAATDAPLHSPARAPGGVDEPRRSLLFRSRRYTERQPFAAALAEQDAWAAAAKRFFTSMGTGEHPSAGWHKLRQWLSGFDEPGTDDAEALEDLMDHQLVDPAASPDARMIRLLRWLAPDGPPMCRGVLLDTARLLPVAERARGATDASDPDLSLVDALWRERLLPELALLPAGRGLERVDAAWRACWARYRAAGQRFRATMPASSFAVVDADDGPPQVLASLLCLVLDPDREGDALRTRLRLTEQQVRGVEWFGRASASAGGDPAAVAALLRQAPAAVAESERTRRDVAAARRVREGRQERWDELERQRTSPPAVNRAMGSAVWPFAGYAAVMAFTAVLSSDVFPEYSGAAIGYCALGLLLLVAQLAVELGLAREIGAEYARGYGLFSRAGVGLADRGRSMGRPGCLGTIAGIFAFLFLLAIPIIVYVALAVRHFRSVAERRREWRGDHEAARARTLGSP